MSIEKSASEFNKPVDSYERRNGNSSAYPNEMGCGLTKRELFAAMAMQGQLADPNSLAEAFEIAEASVELADALLAELAKEKKE